jgi:hypothetical protein
VDPVPDPLLLISLTHEDKLRLNLVTLILIADSL